MYRLEQKPIRVIIVEDEAIIAMDIEARVTALGYYVVGSADTAKRALEIAETAEPALALTDIHIAGEQDGVELASQLSKKFGIPSIFLTAYSDDVTLSRAASVGPFGYLIKPFANREVKAAIEVALQRQRMENEIRAWKNQLERKVDELNEALGKVKELSGLLPICSCCKRVRDESGYWEELSAYLAAHSNAQVLHGICNACKDSNLLMTRYPRS